MFAIDQTPPLNGAALDINLRGQMSYHVADALEARGVGYIFMTGYIESYAPLAYDQVVFCEKPIQAERVISAFLAGLRSDT